MPHPLLKVYAQLDGQVKQAIKGAQLKPSCKKGCTHCCYIMTAMHAVEGVVLAQAVMKLPNWKEIAQKAREVSFKLLEHGHDRGAFFRSGTPCPLLNVEKGECSVYEKRPSVCRLYMVVSDPAKCAPSHTAADVSIVNTSYFEAKTMQFCIEVSGGVLVLAPIPLMLLFSLPKATKTKEDEAFIRGLCDGLPDPVQWMKQYDEIHEHWKKEDPTAVQMAYRESFEKVFGA
jgi:Fe-S-cluster containining protein